MGVQKKPFVLESPLPKDLLLRVDKFTLVIYDDPFEVKLGDNYAVSDKSSLPSVLP